MNGWLIFLTLIAVYRVTRLVTSDYIMEPVRQWAEKRWGKKSKRAYMIGCNWCLSIWLAPGLCALSVYWPSNRAVWLVMLFLAASAAAGMIATVQDYYEALTPEPEEDE